MACPSSSSSSFSHRTCVDRRRSRDSNSMVITSTRRCPAAGSTQPLARQMHAYIHAYVHVCDGATPIYREHSTLLTPVNGQTLSTTHTAVNPRILETKERSQRGHGIHTLVYHDSSYSFFRSAEHISLHDRYDSLLATYIRAPCRHAARLAVQYNERTLLARLPSHHVIM